MHLIHKKTKVENRQGEWMRKVLVALALVLTVAIAGWVAGLVSQPVSAEGWLAQGMGPGLPNRPRGGYGGCSGLGCQSVYTTGVSWIYYEPVDSNTVATVNAEGDTQFVPLNPYQDYNNSTVPTGCAENGFWHFGRNQQASISSGVANFGDFDDAFYACTRAGFSGVYCGAKDMYSTTYLQWGHLGTYTWEYGAKYPYVTYDNGSLDHWIQAENGTPIYRARNYGDYENCGDPTFLDENGNYHVTDNMEELKTCPWEAYKAAFYEKYHDVLEGPGKESRNFNFGDTNVSLPDETHNYARNLYAFCLVLPPDTTKTLTVKYVGTETTEKERCYGREPIITSTNEQELEPTQTVEDEDGDGRIDFHDLHVSKYLSEEWTLAGADTNQPGMWVPEYNDNTLHVDLSKGSVSITFKFEKHKTYPSDEPCDPECDSWTTDAYKKSTVWNADTTVRIGVKNFTLAGWENPAKSGEWHHLTGDENNLLDGPIYAKPTDEVQFKYCYYPGVERAANEMVTHENEDPEPTVMHPTTNHLNNHPFHEYSDWAYSEYKAWEDGTEGGFKPLNEYTEDSTGYTEHSDIGVDEPLLGTLPGGPMMAGQSSEEKDRFYLVQPWDLQTVDILYANRSEIEQKLDPGNEIWGHIITNHGETHVDRQNEGMHAAWDCNPTPCGPDGRQTCYADKCQHAEEFYRNNRNQHQEKDEAKVIIPYNFKNSGTATITNTILYSGEKMNVKNPQVTVGMRLNAQTDGPDRENQGYATDVDSVGKARIVAFLMDGETYESNREESVWNATVKDEDDYGNKADENGKIWVSTEDVCEPGRNTVFNAKFNVCKFLDHYEGSLNENAALDGATYDFRTKEHYTSTATVDSQETYNVFDEAAGNYMCVAAAIYPFSVKSDTDIDKDGDQSWYVSKPSCVKIAKKPTFQVWGSGIYTGGNATTSVSVKNNVLNPNGKRDTSDMNSLGNGSFEGWTPRGGTNVLFGSWVELSATLEGTSTKFSSGAGTGYRGGMNMGNALATWSSSGDDVAYSYGYPAGFLGAEQGTYCKRSPMSIGNMNCDQYVGLFKEASVSDSTENTEENNEMAETLKSDVENMIATFSPEAAATGIYTYIENGTVTPEGSVSLTDGIVTSIGRGQTVVQVSDSDIRIGKDIMLTPDASTNLSSLSDIAKYIIYTRGSIVIDCEVTRIDAILISNGTINTCDEGDVNDRIRSHQLVINGAVISGGLLLNRTYGASTGEWSVTPAELINYDTSLYLWSNVRAESRISGQVSTSAGQSTGVSSGTSEAAMRELAPRY